MDRHGVRYLVEHRLLPNWFFEKKEQFVGMLLEDKGLLYRIIDDIFEKEKIQNPYSEEQFNIEITKVTDEILMLKIIFPEPEEEPLCYSSYMFFDIKFEKSGYYCIERGNVVGNMEPHVCGWTPDGKHLNFGRCTFEKNADFLRCLEIHLKNHYATTNEDE